MTTIYYDMARTCRFIATLPQINVSNTLTLLSGSSVLGEDETAKCQCVWGHALGPIPSSSR